MDADVIIIGGGISGMATASRLQARGVTTMVLEAHGQVGGCAGFFRKRGFAFDVGATTLVDFEPNGVGGQFLDEIGLPEIDGETLPGYRAWLPDREVTLHRDAAAWQRERLRAFGDTPAHRGFWHLLDHLSALYWEVSRKGAKLPIQSVGALWKASRLVPPRHWGSARYLTWTMADALKAHGLEQDRALRQFLGMLIQDTVHATVETAPLINSALGVTIRGAGLMRSNGGMYGFWQTLVNHYRQLGGTLRVGTRVEQVFQTESGFTVHTRRGEFQAKQVVSTLPIWNTARLGLSAVQRALQPYLDRDKDELGSAVVAFLGVPDAEVEGEAFTHHQILVDYAQPLQNGNNMFISVSAQNDLQSAPSGWRAVMLSTHCDLAEWEGLSAERYLAHKKEIGQRLIDYARRVYPNLGQQAKVMEVGTPLSYAKYTHRHRGAVGGIRQSLRNSNQFAVPYNLGISGFWQAGDTTWPGLGTVACVLGSRHIANAIISGGLS